MGQSCTSTSELEDFAFAAQDLAATACCAALAQARDILAAPASAAGLGNVAHLAGLTRRIETCLEIGSHALEQDDHGSAVLEHARALVLMNCLPLAAARCGQTPIAALPSSTQKSGSTG